MVIKTFLVAVVLTIGAGADGSHSMNDQLRLKPGNYWIYRGIVEWTDANTVPARIGKKQVIIKTEIAEETIHGELKAFLVDGNFLDLLRYDPAAVPQKTIWIIDRGRFYSIAASPGIFARFHNPADSLIDLIQSEEPLLQSPFRLNHCTVELKPEEPRQRKDLYYCWYLENKSRQNPKMQGLDHDPVDVWGARYRTLASDDRVSFSPGIGFISFDYSHHGTREEAHVKLIEGAPELSKTLIVIDYKTE
jgi:hypothetical protein